MTDKKQGGPASDPDINAEIDRTMAEAEAAVEALDRPPEADGESGEPELARDAVEDALAERIAELEDQLAQTKDRWLRAVADHENYKKRSKRETDETVMRKVQALLRAFLPAVDNLDRALETAVPAVANASAENAQSIEQVVKGVQMVRDEFLASLKREGIDPIDSVGQPFDPAVHDALQQIDSPDHAPGAVIREFEKGYKMGDRLLRPARVIVAGAGSGGGAAES
jgi:molecular chaperone GrpE